MQVKLNGRKVEITTISFHGDVVDSFIDAAYYVDNGKELEDEELTQLTDENAELIEREWHENMVSMAEDRYEMSRDVE